MRRLLKILLILLICFIVVIGVAYLYIFQLGGIESIVNARIAALVEQRYRLEVHVGRVKGSYLSDLVIEDVVAYYSDSTHRYQLINIPRIATSYALANLWDERFIFDFLTIDSAEIVLLKDTSGAWVIPDFSRYDAVESFVNGRNVSLFWVLQGFTELALLKTMILLLIAMLLFHRREVAEVSV